MSPRNVEILAVSLLVFHNWSAFPSTAVVIVTKTGIAAATDGKSISDGTSGALQKLAILHKRILIAEIGLAEIRPNKEAISRAIRRGQPVPKWAKNFVPYSFPEWIGSIEKRTSPDISVAMLTETVKNEADRTFGAAAPLLKDMAMQHQPPFQDGQTMVATFVLAGFDEAHVPNIYSIRIELQPDDFSLQPGKIEHVHPAYGISVDARFYMPAGSAQTAILPIMRQPESSEYRRIPFLTKIELTQLQGGKSVSVEQIFDLLTVLISEEISASSDIVGWPIWLGIVPKKGAPSLSRIPKPEKRTKH
jgi:hypothetical protein